LINFIFDQFYFWQIDVFVTYDDLTCDEFLFDDLTYPR